MKLTRNNIGSNLRIALREGIEYPAAARVEPLVRQIVEIGQRAEAVHPEAQLLELGPVEPGVRLHPAGRGEAKDDENEHQDPDAERPLAGGRALPIQFRVGQDVILQTHVFFMFLLHSPFK